MKQLLLIFSIVPFILTAQRDTIKSEGYFAHFLSAFSGGANAMYTGNKLNGSVDITIQTYHFFMVTGLRSNSDSTLSKTQSVKDQYKGFEFFLINRAALDFDSIQNMANNYLTSLQGAPLTLRFMKEVFLTKNRHSSLLNPRPVISLQVNTDLRASPYYIRNHPLKVGASGHIFLTLSTAFTRLELENNTIIDQGTMYFLPTFGFSILDQQIAKSLIPSSSMPLLFSTELKFGFKSSKKSINDTSFIIRYCLTQVNGPQLYTGILLSSLK